jgi:hypothetical protein
VPAEDNDLAAEAPEALADAIEGFLPQAAEDAKLNV